MKLFCSFLNSPHLEESHFLQKPSQFIFPADAKPNLWSCYTVSKPPKTWIQKMFVPQCEHMRRTQGAAGVCYVERSFFFVDIINTLNAELNPVCHLLALLGAHHFLHVSRIRVKSLTLKLLMSYIYIYIYGAPILDVSRSHTTTQHSR